MLKPERGSPAQFSFQQWWEPVEKPKQTEIIRFKYFELYYVSEDYLWLCKSKICMIFDFSFKNMDDIMSKSEPMSTALLGGQLHFFL